MDMANDGYNDELRGICNDLENGKKQLVDTIESGKLKDEKLMDISLKIQEDIESTLKRWDDVKNGRKPYEFKSSFFNDNEYKNTRNDNSANNMNNQNNKAGFDLLGFDDFGENNKIKPCLNNSGEGGEYAPENLKSCEEAYYYPDNNTYVISEQSQNMKEKSSPFDTFQFFIGLRSEIPQPQNII